MVVIEEPGRRKAPPTVANLGCSVLWVNGSALGRRVPSPVSVHRDHVNTIDRGSSAANALLKHASGLLGQFPPQTAAQPSRLHSMLSISVTESMRPRTVPVTLFHYNNKQKGFKNNIFCLSTTVVLGFYSVFLTKPPGRFNRV